MAEKDVELLLDYLAESQPADSNKTRRGLEGAGILQAVLFRGPPDEATAESPDNVAARNRVLLLELARAALKRAVKEFKDARPQIEARIKKAQTMRLVSAIVTTVLTSSAVASLSIAQTSNWGIVLGVLATLSSIATLVAGRLEGGEARLANGFADVSSKYIDARNLLDLVQAYLRHPDLPADIAAVTSRAADLCSFIQKAVVDWKLS